MNHDYDDAVLEQAFARARALEPTNAEISAVLRRLADDRARGQVPSRRRRLHVGDILAVIATASALAVAASAIVLLGHGTRRPVTASASVGARLLIGRLAILRRPQTAQDRNGLLVSSGILSQQGVRSLARFATTVRVGSDVYAVYVIVRLPAPSEPRGVILGGYRPPPGMSHPFSARLGDQVSVVALPTSAGLDEIGAGEPGAYLDEPGNVLTPGGQTGVNASVVPDGVTRVKWVFTGLDIARPKPITIHPRVINNVALSPARTGEGVLASATWYDAGGHVLASYSGGELTRADVASLQLYLRTTSGVSPLLYRNFAVFRGPARAQPPVPAAVAKGLTGGANAGYGLDPAETKYVRVNSSIQIWLVPGSHGLCMVQSGPLDPMLGRPALGVGCGDITDVTGAVTGDWSTGPGPGGTRALIGLVPDGATATVATHAGASIRLHVIDNVGYATSTSGFGQIQIHYSNGQVRTF